MCASGFYFEGSAKRRERASMQAPMSVVTRDTQIRTATLGDRAGLIGACMLARSRRFAEPSK